jgi:peptide/nickel transport system substrate-binding protein
MRRKHLVSLSMLSVGVALLVAATSVGAASSATSSALRGGTLRINQSAGTFDTLDPQLAYVYNDWELLNATQLLLLNHPDRAGLAGERLVPEAAKTFPTVSKHGTVYTYHLRSGLRFSDGSPVTAAAFQRAFERLLSPKMFAQYGIYDGVDTDIVGGQAFAGTGKHQGKRTTKHISGIDANGLTLTIHLTHPVPSFESLLAMQWFGAIKPNMPYTNSKSGILKYPSAGPYYLASNNLNGNTILKRNRYYRGSRPANPDKIVVHNLTDPDASVRKIEQNKVDLDLGGVPSDAVNAIVQKYGPPSNKNSRFHVDESTCFDWAALNNTRPPTDNVAVRKAVNYALGRIPIVNIFSPYSGTPTDQVLQPGVPGYKKLNAYGNYPNVAKAEQVGGSALKSAPPLDIYYNGLSQTRTQEAELMESELQAIGLKVTMTPETTGDYYGGLVFNAWNIAVTAYCPDFPDPAQFFDDVVGAGNYLHFSNSSFAKKADHAASLSGSARARAYTSLDNLLMTTYAPMAPLYVDNAEYLTSNRVRNYIFSPNFNGPILNALSVR